VTTVKDKHGQSVMHSLWNPQPVQVMEQMRDVIIFPRVTDKASSCMEPVQQIARITRQGCAAVVESRQFQ